jgi:hypothetical protein
MLMGSLYLNNQATNPASAVGTLDATVEAGDTYWYQISEFPSFDDLLNLGGDPGFNETNYLNITSGLEGSMIYAKVMDLNEEEMSYWDGSNVVDNAMLPTVDISTGLITGSAIDFEIMVDGNLTTGTLPAGMGLPLPMIFGTATQFNVSSVPDFLLPAPLVLNDDYAFHETIINQLELQLQSGALFITNDNSQFKVQADNVVIGGDAADIRLNGFVSYNKPSGLLQEINVDVTNTTSGVDLINIDIDLVKEEHTPLDVLVGDTFELEVDYAGFTYSGLGNAADPEFTNDLDNIQGNMTNAIGNILIEFEVVEVDGLYYSVQGSLYNDTGARIDFPEMEENRTDFWFAGFGRYGPGMPIPTGDPARTIDERWIEDPEDMIDGGYYEWLTTPIRQRALPGPVVTPDWEIYSAWDLSLGFVAQFYQETGIKLLQLLEETTDDVQIFSSTSDDPDLSITFTGGQNADDSYSWDLNVDADVGLWVNDTYTDYYWNGTHDVEETHTRITQIAVDGDANVGVDYDEDGRLTQMAASANFVLNVTNWNATHLEGSGEITVNDLGVTLVATHTLVDRPVDTSNTSDTSGTSDTSDTSDSSDTTDDGATTPQVDLPGFELFAVSISLLGMVTIMTRMRRRN